MAAKPALNYFRTVIEEGKKVVWPDRQTVLRHTAMVVIVVAIAAAVFAGIDYGFQKLVLQVIAR